MPLRLAFPPSTSFLGSTRAMVGTWLDHVGAATGDWPLVVTELVTNAISHASETPGSANLVSVELSRDDATVYMTVTNPAPDEFDPDQVRPPQSGATGGRGLMLITALTDGLDVDNDGQVTSVTCWAPAAPQVRHSSAKV